MNTSPFWERRHAKKSRERLGTVIKDVKMCNKWETNFYSEHPNLENATTFSEVRFISETKTKTACFVYLPTTGHFGNFWCIK